MDFLHISKKGGDEMETSTENIILKEIRAVRTELQDFRAENEKRWKENDKRWEQNERRWEENDKRWKQNEKRWEQNDKKLEEINQRLDSNTERITALEDGRVEDRRSILVVLETMQKSIDSQFKEMKDYMDAKFDQLFTAKRENEAEHAEFKKLLCVYGRRIDFHNARIKFLEEWKEQTDFSEYEAV